MWHTLRSHYPEYLMEAAGIGSFMIAAALCTIGAEHPASPVRIVIVDAWIRRVLVGLAMGFTAVTIIYSPWGQRSGAHLNPAVTLTFFRLGKITGWDTASYVSAQFTGGVLGVLTVALLCNGLLADPAVNYAATVPGQAGATAAFVAECIISFILMLVVLLSSNHPRLSRFTGLFAGLLVALYIAVEAPLSGMSMNPARTVASALPAWLWTGLWIYCLAPPIGMLLAAEAYLRVGRARPVLCAKLHHQNPTRCIFNCRYEHARREDVNVQSGANVQTHASHLTPAT